MSKLETGLQAPQNHWLFLGPVSFEHLGYSYIYLKLSRCLNASGLPCFLVGLWCCGSEGLGPYPRCPSSSTLLRSCHLHVKDGSCRTWPCSSHPLLLCLKYYTTFSGWLMDDCDARSPICGGGRVLFSLIPKLCLFSIGVCIFGGHITFVLPAEMREGFEWAQLMTPVLIHSPRKTQAAPTGMITNLS